MNYKAPDNSLHFLEDASFAYLLPVGSTAITDAEAEVLKPKPPKLPIANISPRQIRMELSRAGLRASVEAVVAGGSQDLKDWYEFSTTFERKNAQVIAMGAELGVDAAALDALFIRAGAL